MNKWALKSVEFAKKKDYLDRLQEVYPVEPKKRTIEQKSIDGIRKAFKTGNKAALLNQLLGLKKFPYKDSYVAFLRKDRTAILRNPKTVDRICKTLTSMGLQEVIEGITAEKEANTRRGSSFKQWLKKNFRFVNQKLLENSNKGIVFFDVSDTELRDYANSQLGAGYQKRPDFIAKTGRKYVVGEAKFLSDSGGNQTGGFRDAISVASSPAHRAVKVCVLDGIIWIESGSRLYSSIEHSSVDIFSALLLKDFLTKVASQ